MQRIKLRKANIKDIPSIVELHKRVVSIINSLFYPPEAIKEWLNEISEKNTKKQFDNSNWIVAEINNKIVGFGQYSIGDGQIYQINVDSGYQNQGIGKRLYDYIESDFKNNKTKKICLNSTLNAVGFYKKLGFSTTQKINFKLRRQSLKMVKMEKFL